jgi:cytoskeleton protein RodZ
MTERAEAAPAESIPAAAAAAGAADYEEQRSFGRRLAAERQRLGLSLGELAARLRLHPKQVAAIEAENLDALPGGTFLRGFVRNYAKELKLDPAPLLDDLQRRSAPPPVDQGNGTDLGTPSAVRAALRERLPRVVVIGSALLALLAFALIGWFSSPQEGSARGDAATSQAPASPPVAPPAVEPGEAPTVLPADASGHGQDGAGEDKPAAASVEATVAPTAAAPMAGSSTFTGAALALRFVFGDRPSWIEISQADGRVLYSGMNEAATERRIAGQPPLRLVIGNASSVRLESRGKWIDLAPHTRGEDLARLTVE